MDDTKHGDITGVKSGIVVHGCNAQGKMNSGVAKAIRNKWPEAYNKYLMKYQHDGLKVGDIVIVKINKDLYIVNAIIQEYYGYDGKTYIDYTGLRKCFRRINNYANTLNKNPNLGTINIPMIGAGLAGGNWKLIQKIITDEIKKPLNTTLWLHN